MTAARKIPDAVRGAQIEAADPDRSIFVAANAGSGKTHVLTQRVINLLLRGVDPAKILCITFTKAAAANMASRVFETLAEWTVLPDKALDDRIRLSTKDKPDARLRARARRLFASALETPGGLKVQTIHAFCTRLLQQFPFEANVAARFTVLDEAATAQLLERLTLEVLLETSADEEGALGQALAAAIVAAADVAFKEVVGDAIKARDAIQHWLAIAGGIDQAIAGLARSFGLDPDDSLEKVDAEYFSASRIPEADWPALIEVLAQGGKSDKNHIDALTAARAASGPERIAHYLRVFCTEELTPRKNLLTKAVAECHPDWLARLQEEQARVCALLAREHALKACMRTRALVTIVKAVIDRYQTEKERRGLVDYDDLIDKALPLLSDDDAAWVHYKLDLGIDHVLIDEAQDTSPKQWEIIRLLASEFTSGLGARASVKRTIFAVGDEKQSIFSFQGAAPRAFDVMRRYFAGQFDRTEFGWRHLRFRHSFRSGATVLSSVDQVFRAREIYQSVTTDEVGIPEHQALPDAAPGLVEIWNLIEPAEKRKIEGWDAPFDTESEMSPRVRLAQRIAAHVKIWTARGLKPGEVLVLVRQRGPLFEAIIRSLKDAGVPVAGADRLVLTEHIAVMDLMALADALLLADDDLALASVLKSPLFGLTEEQLFELAWNRKGSLRNALRAKTSDAFFGVVDAELDKLTANARWRSPFAFFAEMLGPRRGRKKFLARLGPEANDALDEFLNLALDYEARETPSLQGFLAWLRAAQSEIKRDMEMARDEVRVMTVHGAKGLEAETVILADTTTDPKGTHPPKLLAVDGALVWAGRRQDGTAAMDAAREAANTEARNEYRRLLYVAMTRAKQRLLVCGAKGPNKIPDGCWYQLVRDALEDDCLSEPADDGDGEVLRYCKGEAQLAPVQKKDAESTEKIALPAWLTSNAPQEKPAQSSIAPSRAGDDETARPSVSGAPSLARLRGLLAHRLLQSLPDIPPRRRNQAAEEFLARRGRELPAEDREQIAQKVFGVLDDARFAALFAPGSRAEVPLVGKLHINGQWRRVTGQVDRLAVTQDNVLIADFKTNRPVLEAAPPDYLTQLALYRAVLVKLYPRRSVHAALVWTETPEIVELSDGVLDASLTQITPA